MINNETIGNKVAEIRRNRRITQEELATNVNVSRQTIIAIEKGNYVPSVLLALKISSFFETPLEQIFKIEIID